MDVAVTSCLAATASAARARLKLQKELRAGRGRCGYRPESILLGTRKIGIISLTESWSRGPLRSWLFDLIASRTFVESSVWNGSAARAAFERAVDGVASIGPVWPIINAYVLEQSFKAQARNGAAYGSISIDRIYKNLRTKATETYADSWRWRHWCE
jgi:hypothetical protein